MKHHPLAIIALLTCVTLLATGCGSTRQLNITAQNQDGVQITIAKDKPDKNRHAVWLEITNPTDHNIVIPAADASKAANEMQQALASTGVWNIYRSSIYQGSPTYRPLMRQSKKTGGPWARFAPDVVGKVDTATNMTEMSKHIANNGLLIPAKTRIKQDLYAGPIDRNNPQYTVEVPYFLIVKADAKEPVKMDGITVMVGVSDEMLKKWQEHPDYKIIKETAFQQ